MNQLKPSAYPNCFSSVYRHCSAQTCAQNSSNNKRPTWKKQGLLVCFLLAVAINSVVTLFKITKPVFLVTSAYLHRNYNQPGWLNHSSRWVTPWATPSTYLHTTSLLLPEMALKQLMKSRHIHIGKVWSNYHEVPIAETCL